VIYALIYRPWNVTADSLPQAVTC